MKECQWLDRHAPPPQSEVIINLLVSKARLEALLEAIISVLVCKARLEALLEAAGISKLAENKELADPDVIKRLTSSVRYSNIRFRLLSLISNLYPLSILP
jgi:hypothetical protein